MVVAACWVFSGPSGSLAQGTVYFRENFNVRSSLYSFANRFPQNGWTVEHLDGGGWNGSGGTHIVMQAGRTQYQFGYQTGSLGRNFALGDDVYIRFRIKYDANMRGNENWGNKFILMGTPQTSPNSRLIVYMQTVSDSQGCTLGMRDYSNPGGSTPYSWAVPSYFGISGHSSFSSATLMPYSWSLAPYVNVGWDCAPPIYQTVPTNPFNGRPGPANSALPSGGWYHVQVYARSGGAGAGQFKVWANNNNVGSPSSQKIGLPEGLGVQGWSAGVTVGGYMDNDTPSVNLGYTLDDFEVSSAFDPGWYPGGGSTTPPPPSTQPRPPTSVRIIR